MLSKIVGEAGKILCAHARTLEMIKNSGSKAIFCLFRIPVTLRLQWYIMVKLDRHIQRFLISDLLLAYNQCRIQVKVTTE